MHIRLIKKAELVTSKWNGGTTTQLFIHPDGTSYDKRDFVFRVSTATVEKDRSAFTWLPGIRRKLMVLDGTMIITHKDQHSKQLSKFEQDEFDGGWETSAEGKVTDFNLMLREGAEGHLEGLILEPGTEYGVSTKNQTFVYVFKGRVQVKTTTQRVEAEVGDVVVLHQPEDFFIYSEGLSELVLVNID